jgi:hypothetical protein
MILQTSPLGTNPILFYFFRDLSTIHLPPTMATHGFKHDPLLETLALPTHHQIVPQPHTTESTTNETTMNYPNQEQTTMWTHGFKHHSLPTVEPPSESPPQVLEKPNQPWNEMTDQSIILKYR